MSWSPSIRAHSELSFSNGHVTQYDGLVSSVPLPDLIRMIQGAPPDVVDAARRLACSTCVLVNIGVNRADLSNAHMTYFYDEDICFTRLGFPHMLSAQQRSSGHRQHPGGSLLLGQVQAFHRFTRRLDRASHQRSSAMRPPARGRPDLVTKSDVA